MVDLACGCRKGLQLPDRLCPYHEGYQDGYDAGFADGVACVCDETSMRNCPVHQNDGLTDEQA